MGSGIVSIDLHSAHQPVLSAIMLWFAAGVWLLLAVMLGMRLAYQRDRFEREASSPAAFTGVAGTAVLGTRLALQDYHAAAAALLAVSGVVWALLVVPVLRHWKTPTVGVSFVLVVATEGLAVLGATLAVSYHAGWLVSVAVAALVLGLAFYVFTAARFDWRDLVTGHGDQWVAGGSLAISALAAGKITDAARALGQFSGLHSALSTGTLVLWCLAIAWLLPLIAARDPQAPPHLRRTPLGHCLSARHVRRLQLRDRPGHRHLRHHRLWPGVDVGRVHRQPASTRRAVPSRLAGAAWSAPPGHYRGPSVDGSCTRQPAESPGQDDARLRARGQPM